eukprot:TRINITY_DN49165_c0_g1_i1.p1 TRINITY_DN49165_c0_g1~~TRINITY_DN49165_c0_g1_i1.p1  ORF type:complete len:229 (-),score=30.82 TRINITY_DN49165_c0_g1_i1:238-924(-)
MLRLPGLQLLRHSRLGCSQAFARHVALQFRACASKVPREPKGTTEEVQLYLEPTNFLDVATTPLRHLSHSVAINVVNYMLPFEWDWNEFSDGAGQAARAVHSLLGEQDFSALQGLVTNSLLGELEGSKHKIEQENWLSPPKLIEVDTVALFSSRSVAPENDTDAPALRVTPMMKVLEEYSYKGSEKPRRFRRLLKWEFERRIHADRPAEGSWQLSGVGHTWFLPRSMP